jgi:hypothetical protein
MQSFRPLSLFEIVECGTLARLTLSFSHAAGLSLLSSVFSSSKKGSHALLRTAVNLSGNVST